MNCWLAIGFSMLLIWLLLMIIKYLLGKNSHYKLETDIKNKPNIAILIPARDEADVIEDLLKSIFKQTYPIKKENVYVIVENNNDKTVKIGKEYGINVFVRKKLELGIKECKIEIEVLQKCLKKIQKLKEGKK